MGKPYFCKTQLIELNFKFQISEEKAVNCLRAKYVMIHCSLSSACGVIINVMEIDRATPSSKPGRGCLHFT